MFFSKKATLSTIVDLLQLKCEGCQLLHASFLFFTAPCTSSDHHEVSNSLRFWPLVTPQTFFAVSTILYFSLSHVTSWSFIFCCTSRLNFTRFSPFSFQLLIHGFCFSLCPVLTLCILIFITSKRRCLTAASPGITAQSLTYFLSAWRTLSSRSDSHRHHCDMWFCALLSFFWSMYWQWSCLALVPSLKICCP